MAERRILLANKIGDSPPPPPIFLKEYPPKDEIWYYTNDGDIIHNINSPIEIISNTYDKKGILKFKQDLEYLWGVFFAYPNINENLIKIITPHDIGYSDECFGYIPNLIYVFMGIPHYIGNDIFDNCINLKEFSCIITNIAWNSLVNSENSRSVGWADDSNIEIVNLVDENIIVSD